MSRGASQLHQAILPLLNFHLVGCVNRVFKSQQVVFVVYLAITASTALLFDMITVALKHVFIVHDVIARSPTVVDQVWRVLLNG